MMRLTSVGVIGCGIIAQGIAQNAAVSKLEVTMWDENMDWLQACLENLGTSLDNEISRWGLTPGDKKAIQKRIAVTTDLGDLGRSQVILEAKGRTFEDKKNMILKLEEICSDDTLLMTNSTTISISDIQKQMRRPDRLIGLHFILPVPKSVIVEVIKGIKTAEAVVFKTKVFMEALGKRSIEVFEYPGFVTARIILPMINTAAHVLMEGLATADDIDDAIHFGYNLSTGPLAMADIMGLDVVLNYLDSIFRNLGDPAYRACPVLRKLVRDGKLGVKTGEGFFKYDEFMKRVKSEGGRP